MKCSVCGVEVDKLELFSLNRCLKCFEMAYNEDLNKSGVIPKPDFVGCLNDKYTK